MKSILKQIFSGDLNPMDGVFPDDPEYISLWQHIEAEEQYLTDVLSPEARSHLTQYQTLLRRVYHMEEYTSFSSGFRLGMGLLWEVVNADT